MPGSLFKRSTSIPESSDKHIFLVFLEKYFQDKNAKPLKTGPALVKQIFE